MSTSHASGYGRGVRNRMVGAERPRNQHPRDRPAGARLYLCTDARRDRGDLAEFADAALSGGVDIIQLRDKGSVGEQRFGALEAREELAALEVLADAARRHGALVAVNDRADIARAAGADVCTWARGPARGGGARDRRAQHRSRVLHP